MAEFIIAIILAVAAVGGIVVAIKGDFPTRNPRVIGISVAIFVILLAGGMIAQSMYQSVPTKSEGVITSYGKVVGHPFGPGGHWVAPWRTVNIVQNTIQSDTFSERNGGPNTPDVQTPRGTTGYCITVRLAGLNSGCANVQLQTQLAPEAIPGLYANYSSYGPSLAQDVDQFVVKRELTTDLNRVLGDYNVISDIATNLTACIKNQAQPANSQKQCSAVTQSQFSQFDGKILKELSGDVELKGKINVLDVNLQNIVFNGSTEDAIKAIQNSYLDTVKATQQEKTNAATSLANAALIQQKNALTPAVLANECYTTTLAAIKANVNLPASWNCSGSSPSGLIVNGK